MISSNNLERDSLLSQLEKYQNSKMKMEAEELISILSEKYPEDKEVWSGIGHYYSFAKEFDKAANAMTSLIKIQPDQPAAYFNRSKSYLALSNFLAALKDAEKVIELGHFWDDHYYTQSALFLKAESLCKLRRFDEAKAIASDLKANAGWWLSYGYRGRDDILMDCSVANE